MGSIYEKLESSQNPPISHDRPPDPSIKDNKKAQRASEEPTYYDKAGLEPMFTKTDPDLAYSEEAFRTNSRLLPIEQKTSEVGKLGISTDGMAETLNEGEREMDYIKEDLGVPQKNKNVDAD